MKNIIYYKYMPDHNIEDYKQSAVGYLVGDNSQEEVCQIFVLLEV